MVKIVSEIQAIFHIKFVENVYFTIFALLKKT